MTGPKFTTCPCGKAAIPFANRMVCSLPEGAAVLIFPIGMSAQSVEELTEALAHQLRVLRRTASTEGQG